MPFTLNDFNELKDFLIAHPESRIELRRLLLPEGFDGLPDLIRELVELQRKSEERLTVVEERLTVVEERLTVVEERLTVVEKRLEAIEARMERLEVRMDQSEIKLGRLEGESLENKYRSKAPAFFGRWLRRTQVADINDLVERVEPHLGPDEIAELLLTDLIVHGRVAKIPNRPEVWLVVEISSVVDREDVARAVRRAELLRKAGLPAVPVVAGRETTEGAETAARDRGVALLRDGAAELWDEALAAWPV